MRDGYHDGQCPMMCQSTNTAAQRLIPQLYVSSCYVDAVRYKVVHCFLIRRGDLSDKDFTSLYKVLKVYLQT